jgi:hypothetical protein
LLRARAADRAHPRSVSGSGAVFFGRLSIRFNDLEDPFSSGRMSLSFMNQFPSIRPEMRGGKLLRKYPEAI